MYILITPLFSSHYPFGIFLSPFWHLLIYPFGIIWFPLWYILITHLVYSDFLFGIFWFPLWHLLITHLVYSDYSFSIFWLPLWHLQSFALTVASYFCKNENLSNYLLFYETKCISILLHLVIIYTNIDIHQSKVFLSFLWYNLFTNSVIRHMF